MRASMAVCSAALTIGVMAACNGSSTAPANCDGQTTSASFVEGAALTGVVTQIAVPSATAGATKVVAVRVHGDPDYTIGFTVSTATAVFQQHGGSAPTPSNACRLSVGEQVQFPADTYLSGFGDYLPSGNDPAPPLPPAVTQIVIVR